MPSGERARCGAIGLARQSGEAVCLHVLRLLRGDRRFDHFLGIDGVASCDRDDVRIERHRRRSSRRHLHVGGRGTIGGTIIGAFVIGILSDGLVMMGVSEFWQMVIKGVVIIAAVVVDQAQRKLQQRVALQQMAQLA